MFLTFNFTLHFKPRNRNGTRKEKLWFFGSDIARIKIFPRQNWIDGYFYLFQREINIIHIWCRSTQLWIDSQYSVALTSLSKLRKTYKTVPIFLGFLTYIFQFSEFYWRYNCNEMFEMHYLFQCWITSAWYIRLWCRELQQRKENYKDMWKCRRNQNRFFSPSSCLPIWRGNSNRGSASC